VKKKLAGLDMRIQIGLVVLGVLIFAFVGRMFLVSPQNTHAADLRKQIESVNTDITTRQLQTRHAAQPQAIQVADLFRLAKAMPEREDMPGIILTISQVARDAGIHFDTIEPGDIGPAPVGSYRVRKIHLTFNGDFYSLSDFLYRLRNLVTVHDGRLDANGRLFTVESMTFTLGQSTFPNISADLTVQAYMYGTGPAAAAPTTPVVPGTTDTTATTTTTPSTDTAPPDGATAAGVTP
jgi:Tfp pilus assembly protein PilO